jgi:3-oxoadipate enol-lactonase
LSPAPTEPFNAADDVRALLDSLGIGEAAIVGASYGGRVAQEIAARWPDRVSALILLCAATRLHPPTAAIEIQLAAGDAAQPRESVFVRNADFDLSAVTGRTIFVSGDHNVDYFRTTADHLAESIPGALLVALPWAGHLPTLEAPATMNPLILHWLDPSAVSA